jgi:DNA-binding NarL/FixJ family response regulator
MDAPTDPTRVVIVDDQATIRLGLRMIVDHEPDIVVVGEAGDGEQAVSMARALRPHVVLMDIRMPRMDGIEATTIIAKDPELESVRTLVLTTFGEDEYVFGALRAGAAGFLLKDTDPQTLVDAVRQIREGNGLLDPAITRGVVESYVTLAQHHRGTGSVPPDADLETLTPREHEILLVVARGLSNKEVGAELHLSEATVKSHVRSVLTKLGLSNRVQLVIRAYEAGLVRPGDEG